eukprot:NODE_287_length_10726_cov_0.240614.p1 type:complete len:1727 gc:universal NODE_287_length_10726_cov_0.240614:1929-7109(+)
MPDKIKCLTLWNQFSATKEHVGNLLHECDIIKAEIQQAENEVKEIKTLKRQGWNLIHAYLGQSNRDYYRAFLVPHSDGFKIAGKGKKIMDSYYLFESFFDGKKANQGILKSIELDDDGKVWDLPLNSRKQLIENWRSKLINDLSITLQNNCFKYQSLKMEIQDLQRNQEIEFIRKKRVLSCTTSGASKYSSHLDAYGADIIIVEEAGEILESHVVASLNDNCKHLIMIGDHQQLRAKVNLYDLAVQSGKGHNLNVSLFERLIKNGFRSTTLNLQHRMRPEVSEFAKITYPDLKDAPKTKNRANLMGCLSNIIFVHHENLETSSEGSESASKTNAREIDLILGILKYLIQNGYKTSQIVILTPYLAQLAAIRNQLSIFYKTIVSDMDSVDLARFQLDSSQDASQISSLQSRKLDEIRAATVDNFQGEESDIVIASMVRSNVEGLIGFCGEPERVNVLLSRARLGMIVIGNRHTFDRDEKKNNMWPKVFKIMDERKYVFPGFPTVCQIHSKEQLVISPSDFEILSPNGGCNQVCGVSLYCGHKCTRKCHISDRSHKYLKCGEKQIFVCEKLHDVLLNCSTTEDPNNHCKQCKFENEKAKLLLKQAAIDQEILELQLELKKQEALENESEDLKKKQKQKKDLENQLQKLKDPVTLKVTKMVNKFSILSNLPDSIVSILELVEIKLDDLVDHALSDPSLFSKFGLIWDSAIEDVSNEYKLGINKCLDSWTDGLKYFQMSQLAEKELYCSLCRLMVGDESIDEVPNGTTLVFHMSKCKLHFIKKDFTKAFGHGLLFLTCVKYLGGCNLPKDWEALIISMLSDIKNIVEKSVSNGSPATLAWVKLCSKGHKSTAMEKLLKLEGLEKIKNQFIKIFKLIQLVRSRSNSEALIEKKRMNILLMGNPGTGKTTVARIYAEYLAELGILSGSAFEETTGAKLVQGGVSALKECLKNIEENGGGLLFVDEAYQLDPLVEMNGRHVMDLLLTEIENKIGKLVVAFAGYEKKIEKLMAYNEGLPSRFPYQFVFEDYSDELLGKIMRKLIVSSNFEIEDEIYFTGLTRRIGMGRGKEGFGNARTVQNQFDKMVESHFERVSDDNSDHDLLTAYDFLGPNPRIAFEKSESWNALNSMIGLSKVKSSIQSFVELVESNYKNELQGKKPNHCSLNRVLVGNPGTGKTTVGQLYGCILKDLGLLSNGDVVLKNPSDFIGDVIGASEKNTKAILDSSVGKVLVIDEAYGFYDKHDPFKKAVIDTIVAEVQNVPGDDRCVLLLGYDDQMREMMNKSNPGLSRRFNMNNAFVFDDYNDIELMQILNLKLKQRDIVCSTQIQQVAVQVLSKQRNKKNFGNGGAVESLISEALLRMSNRKAEDLAEFDFDPEFGKPKVSIQLLLDSMIGSENIKKSLTKYQKEYLVAEKTGRNPEIPMAFRFVGPPGTGKTKTARKMGEFFYNLGLLGSSKVIEASASDLIGQYVGQTSPKVVEVLEKGLGQVLFIDEAYRLNTPGSGGFAKEALDEIVDQMTKPRFFKKLVVILAGYKEDVDKLMSSNPGLKSRFPEEIIFENFSAEQCDELFRSHIKSKNYKVSGLSLIEYFGELRDTENWGNGRDLKTMGDSLILLMNNHVDLSCLNAESEIFIPDEIAIKFLNDEIAQRRNSNSSQPLDVETIVSAIQTESSNIAAPKIKTESKMRVKTEIKSEEKEEKKRPQKKSKSADKNQQNSERDPGISFSRIRIKLKKKI